MSPATASNEASLSEVVSAMGEALLAVALHSSWLARLLGGIADGTPASQLMGPGTDPLEWRGLKELIRTALLMVCLRPPDCCINQFGQAHRLAGLHCFT
jgi:hypothetical protein